MTNRRVLITLVIAFLLVLSFSACEKGGSSLGPALRIDKVTLTQADKDFLLATVKARVRNEVMPNGDKKIYPNLFSKKKSALFVSLTFPEKTAILDFGRGQTMMEALDKAAGNVMRLATPAELKSARIRVDVVNVLRKKRVINKEEGPKFEPSIHGVYMQTTPPLALHPLEIVSRGMYRIKGPEKKSYWKFEKKGFKKILKYRGLSSSRIKALVSEDIIPIRPFGVDSFIEDSDGKALDLYRWSKKEIKITPELILERAKMAGKYLQSIVKENGQFDYRFYPETNRSMKGYNLLRHCGTTYALGQLYDLTKDPHILVATIKAIEYVMKNHLTDPRQDVHADLDWQCIRGEGYNDGHRDYCKLGGGGLFLVALSTYTMATEDEVYLPTMEKLAKFIEYMQKEDGAMVSKYYFNDNWHKPFTSLFYPGEASYGLGLLYQLDKNMHWIDVGQKATGWLAEEREGTVSWRLPIDHWLIIAQNELYKAKKNEINKNHVLEIAKGIIQKQRIDQNQLPEPDIYGGWGRRPGTSSNATQTEGLVAAYHLAKQSGDDPEPFFAAAYNAINMLFRLQYMDVGTSYFENPKKIIGGHMHKINKTDIQIDDTQHTLSALIGVYKILQERKGKPADTTLYYKWREEMKKARKKK